MAEGLVPSDADVRHPRSMRLADALATDYLQALDQRCSGEVHHVATGFAQYGPTTLHEGHLVILAGRPAMGSSSTGPSLTTNEERLRKWLIKSMPRG